MKILMVVILIAVSGTACIVLDNVPRLRPSINIDVDVHCQDNCDKTEVECRAQTEDERGDAMIKTTKK